MSGRVAPYVRTFFLGLGVVGLSGEGLALEVPPLQAHVMDLAEVVDADSQRELEQKLADYEKASGQQFAILTLTTLEGENIDDFAVRVFEKWQLGSKKKDDGLLIVLSVNDRKVRIEVGYGLEGLVTDALASRVIREIMGPEFIQGAYPQGLSNGLDALFSAAAGQVPADLREPDQVATIRGIPIHVIIFVVFVLLSMLLPRRRRRGFLGGMGGMGGPWISGGGGSFGGGFSGGGGRSGGGGASGGW